MTRIGRGLLLLFLIGVTLAAEKRQKRQANYGGYGGNYNGAAPYRAAPQQHQYQPQPQQNVQHYPPKSQQRPSAHNAAPGEEEKEKGPHPLEQLLENSKFECGPKKDGYYADGDVGCQAFHYCVGGHKHSMMCPGGTVFHQVHLNCVPSDQDICSKADKFYFVNDYLHKQLEQKGPNNTVQYHQRYYPDGYAVGDPFIPPQENKQQPQHQQAQHQHAQHQQQQGYAPAPAYQHQPQQHAHQNYAPAPPKAPFTPQQALYGPPKQGHTAPKPVYHHQPAPAIVPYQGHHAQPRPVHHPQPQPHAYQPISHNNYDNRPQQSQAQALQAHRAAEQAVLAQHYRAQQAQEQQNAAHQQQHVAHQPQPVHPQAAPPQYIYGAAARGRYGQQY